MNSHDLRFSVFRVWGSLAQHLLITVFVGLGTRATPARTSLVALQVFSQRGCESETPSLVQLGPALHAIVVGSTWLVTYGSHRLQKTHTSESVRFTNPVNHMWPHEFHYWCCLGLGTSSLAPVLQENCISKLTLLHEFWMGADSLDDSMVG
eukprot:2877253-Amphidinium_carterae.1